MDLPASRIGSFFWLLPTTQISERGVQTVLRRLQDDGWLEVEVGGGRKGCNVYRIKTPHQMHPNRQEPSKNRQKKITRARKRFACRKDGCLTTRMFNTPFHGN